MLKIKTRNTKNIYIIFELKVLASVFCTYRNIVSTVNLDCKLDLKAIALQARNAEYNPKVLLSLCNMYAHTTYYTT